MHFRYFFMKLVGLIILLMMVSHFAFSQSAFDTTQTQKGKHTVITIKNKQGHLKEIIRLQNGLKEGYQESYSNSGVLLQKVAYHEGKLHGKYFVYDWQGNINEMKYYAYNAIKNTSWIQGKYLKYEKGILVYEANYKDSMLHGSMKEYFRNGKLKTIANYNSNLLTGEYISYGTNGFLSAIKHYTVMHIDNNLISVLQGESKLFDQSGAISVEEYYVNGMKEGICKYYQAGILSTSTMYHKDKVHGPYSTYNNSILLRQGILYAEIEIDGKLAFNIHDGTKTEYYNNGITRSIEHYVMGKKVGVWEQFYEDGKLKELKEFDNNLQIGKSVYWDHKGNKAYEASYRILQTDTAIISVKHGKELRWVNGALQSENNFENGKEVGEQIAYYTNGQLKQKTNVVNERMNGLTSEYHENGKMKSLKNYYSFIDKSNTLKSVSLNWRYEYDTSGYLINSFYSDSLGETLLGNYYYKQRLVQYSITDLLQINYFPDGKLMSLIVNDRYKQIAFAQYYFRNGKTRKLSLQNIEHNIVNHIDYTDEGKLLYTYSSAHENPDSLKPSKPFVEKYLNAIGQTYIDNKFYTDTIKEGKYELFYANGKRMAELNFKNNLPHGNFVFFDALLQDTLLFKQFVNGKQQGYYIEKFGGKHTIVQGEIASENINAWQAYYKNDGTPVQKTVYNKQNVRILHNEYHENGMLKSTLNDQLGTYANYDQMGNLLYHSELIKDTPKLIRYREYYPKSKQVKQLRYYVNDKQDSTSESYFVSGQLASKVSFSEGKMNGVYIEYDEAGKLKRKGAYVNNLPEGVWMIVYEQKIDTQFYANGKLSVMPSNIACSCIDTTISNSTIRYLPSLQSMIEYDELKTFISYSIHPIDSFNYQSIFMSGFQSSNSSNLGFATMKLYLLKEFSFSIPSDNQLKIVLNPCITKGYLQTMETDIQYGFDSKKNVSASMYPKRISIEFLKGPLKSNDIHHKYYKALFDVDGISYNNGSLDIEFNETTNACFSKGIIKNFLNVQIHKANALIYKKPDRYFQSLPKLTASELNNFFGLSIDSAIVNFNYPYNQTTISIKAKSNFMLAGGNYVAGKINIPCKKMDIDAFQVHINDQAYILSMQVLKLEWLKKGFTRVSIDYNEEISELNIYFFAE